VRGGGIVTQHIVTVFECNDCGERYPMIPYYPKAATHGPAKDCVAPSGWTPVKEPYPPKACMCDGGGSITHSWREDLCTDPNGGM